YESDELVFHVDPSTGLNFQGKVSDLSQISRGVFINNMLYTISDTSVQVHALDNLSQLVAQVALPLPSPPWWWPWWERGWDPPLTVKVVADAKPGGKGKRKPHKHAPAHAVAPAGKKDAHRTAATLTAAPGPKPQLRSWTETNSRGTIREGSKRPSNKERAGVRRGTIADPCNEPLRRAADHASRHWRTGAFLPRPPRHLPPCRRLRLTIWPASPSPLTPARPSPEWSRCSAVRTPPVSR